MRTQPPGFVIVFGSVSSDLCQPLRLGMIRKGVKPYVIRFTEDRLAHVLREYRENAVRPSTLSTKLADFDVADNIGVIEEALTETFWTGTDFEEANNGLSRIHELIEPNDDCAADVVMMFSSLVWSESRAADAYGTGFRSALCDLITNATGYDADPAIMLAMNGELRSAEHLGESDSFRDVPSLHLR